MLRPALRSQVNAALDELATCSEANSRLMAAARAASSRLTGAERKRAVELFHSVAVSGDEGREQGRGRVMRGAFRWLAALPGGQQGHTRCR